jgi:phenylacetate-CoA ligase
MDGTGNEPTDMIDAESIYRRSPRWAQTLFLNAHAWRIESHRYGSMYRRAVRDLLASERWPETRIRVFQNERIRQLVSLAYARSPFYRQVWDEAGVKPGDVRGVEDLPRLPVIDKASVREYGTRMMTAASAKRDWVNGHTSGTTGSPLSVWYDRETCIMTNAVDRRQKIWGGMENRDWVGMFLGRVIVPMDQSEPPFWRPNWVQKQVWFSSFHLSDEFLPQYFQEIRRRRLRFLEGYPSTLYVLARSLERRGERLPMRAVFTSSETLLPIQRQAIESAFSCRVFDFFGHAERVAFATECDEHNGKHIAEEFGVVEVTDASGAPVPDGEPGFLVGTSLHNTAMPLFRYRTTDVTAILGEPCRCGRTLRRIRDVTTKAEDIVVTPDGRMVSPSILTHPFKPLVQVLKSQLIQDRLDHIIVKIVPSSDFGVTDREHLIRELQLRLGSSMSIDVELVGDIPRESSGKYRWVISHLQHASQVSWE